MQPGAPKKQTSVWVYVGCGCAGLLILVMIAMAGATWFAYRQGQELKKAWTDPATREARAKEVVPYEKLPEGYYPMGSFSIPFLMEMALFTDNPPAPGSTPETNQEAGGFKERGFIYVNARQMGDKAKELKDYVEGKGAPPDWLDVNVKSEEGEVVGQGDVDVNGTKVVYRSSRGKVSHDNKTTDGITTMMLFDCPGDGRVRVGIWFGPDPDPAKPKEEISLAGTNADPEAMKAFVSHFRVCG